jgi:hypothetical protein
MEDLIINESYSVHYSSAAGGVLISTGNALKTKAAAGTTQKPDSPLVKPTGDNSTAVIAKWGEDNLFPQRVLCEIENNTIIGSTLDWKARALYAGGVEAGKVSYNANGKQIFTPLIYQPFEEFKKRSAFNRYLIEACGNFYYLYNVFPEFVLSNDRKQIVAITVQDAPFCRWGLQNPKTGLVEWCYVNANWDKWEDEYSQYTARIPVLDPYYDPVGSLRERDDSFKYIYPVSYPTPGKVYYQLAHWNSIRKSGWLDVAAEIVKFKKYLLKNQLTIKYHIKVPEYYWGWKYPKWASYTEVQKKQIIKDELDAFNKFLQGTDNAGKSIMTIYKFDPHMQKAYQGWIIEAIDDKTKDGAYIEDSQEASSHILYALGVDATLIGTTPGKGLGAGSGSDKRVAFNIYMSLCQIHQSIILEPLEIIRDYNGWDPEIQFRFRNPLIETLDSGQQTTTAA